jgi:hypothetical protein
MQAHECRTSCYLERALRMFGEVARNQFKREKPVDLQPVEVAFESINSSVGLTKKVLEEITTAQHWDPEVFSFQKPEAWSDKLRSKEIRLKGIDVDQEAFVLQNLRRVSGSLTNATVLLRFTDPPNHFILAGYLSPFCRFFPGPLNYTDEVKAYIALRNDLRALGQAHRLDRVADVDMALWTIWMLQKDGVEKSIVTAYHEDALVRSWRAERADIPRIIEDFDSNLTPDGLLGMAEYFNSLNPRIAGMLAGAVFEELINSRVPNPRSDMGVKIQHAFRGEPQKASIANQCWGTRNTCVHTETFEKKRRKNREPNLKHDLQKEVSELILFARNLQNQGSVGDGPMKGNGRPA